MLKRPIAVGALALAALALISSARAEDTVRLSLPGSADAGTLNLKATQADLGADTIAVAGGRAGGGRAGGGRAIGGRGGIGVGRAVGYRGGFYGGYRGGYYGGYRGLAYGGYRGLAYGGYRGGYYGGYRGFYYPRYYGGLYYPGLYSYYPGYCYSPVYYSYPVYSSPVYAYYYPSSLSTVIPSMPSAGSLSTMPPAADPPAVPGTFPYDGGPRAPLPVPQGEETTIKPPQRPALIGDLQVSLKATGGKWNYPAYGEKPTRSTTYPVQPAVVAGVLR